MCFLKPKATHMDLQRGAQGAARLAQSPTHLATSPSLLSFVRREFGRICTELQMARLSKGASEGHTVKIGSAQGGREAKGGGD